MQDDEKISNPSGKKAEKSSSTIRVRYKNLKPEYVEYILRMAFDLTISDKMAIKQEDSSKYPVVVTDAYVPNTAVAMANVTIKGTVYTFPEDFDLHYTFHSELNEVTGNGIDMIKETLQFKNLPGTPTLTGLVELKNSGCIYSPKTDFSHAENIGNFPLVGTGIFKRVKGSGIATFGASTRYLVYHIAWIKGWPL